jgi:hypothetical protein
MTKREEYGLTFYKVNKVGLTFNICQQTVPNWSENNILTFLSHIDAHETKSFIDDLEKCINYNTNVDEGFFSDGVENMTIIYSYPNVVLEGILTIPMYDLKLLLEEWLDFMQSKFKEK